MFTQKGKVTPEKAIKILKEYGTNVTVDEAKLILDLMYKFGKLAIEQQERALKSTILQFDEWLLKKS